AAYSLPRNGGGRGRLWKLKEFCISPQFSYPELTLLMIKLVSDMPFSDGLLPLSIRAVRPYIAAACDKACKNRRPCLKNRRSKP
ncbi:hypothetical protein, partial [Bergeriella denitrificans]|uniref:hypothetical protein n=1 Tax=Bergeriella denitrificans TaxID=494 RepID=UPI001C3FCFC7